MKQFLVDTLRLLERVLPPIAASHHSVHYAEYGSDETGWEDRLAIDLNGQVLFLDAEDFDCSPEELVDRIVAAFRTGSRTK